MVPFEDTVRMALEKKETPCTVGLNSSQEWRLDKSGKVIKKVSSQVVRGYLGAWKSTTYTMPDEVNMTVFMVFEADDIDKMENLAINVSVEDSHKVIENFTIKNFEKGFFGFEAMLFFNKSIEKFTISTDSNVFYAFTLKDTKHPKLILSEDEYLYLYLKKDRETEFILKVHSLLFSSKRSSNNPPSPEQFLSVSSRMRP